MRSESLDKDLVTGSYDLVALDILSEGPTYAYGMIRKIYEQSQHRFYWHEGTAYRVLHDLERRGWATSAWLGRKGGRRRRYYQITERGRRVLRERRGQWRQFRDALDSLLGRR